MVGGVWRGVGVAAWAAPAAGMACWWIGWMELQVSVGGSEDGRYFGGGLSSGRTPPIGLVYLLIGR